jgi:GNAT superfamily N-acetyltransferase
MKGSIAREALTDALIEESRPLLKENWIVSGSFNPALPLDPDFALYKRMDEAGNLLVLTIRAEDARLVGYVVFAIGYARHHRGVKIGKGEALYVDPEYREMAHDLMDVAEDRLRSRGVERVGWFVVRSSAAYHFLVKRKHFEDEVVLEKMLHVPGD